MEHRVVTEEMVREFERCLHQEEKSPVTVEKYVADVRAFMAHCGERKVSKDLVLVYKQDLMERYAARSVNSKLASLNSLFTFLGWSDCRVKNLKLQQQTFLPEEKELSKENDRTGTPFMLKQRRLRLLFQLSAK